MTNKTSKELKVIAKELGVKGWWDMKKEDLIKAIEEKQKTAPEDQQAEAEQKAREYAAMKAYDKNWKKYTKTYNPLEFIEKFRSGEIEITDEELQAADTPVEEKTEQLKPKRGQLIEFNGKAQNICAWAKELGISANTLYARIYSMGWTVEKAFTTVARKK